MIVFAAVSNCNFYILNFDYCVYVCMCYTVHVCAYMMCVCLCSGRVCMHLCVCSVCSCMCVHALCVCTCVHAHVCMCMHFVCVCTRAWVHTPWYMYKVQGVKLALQVLLPTDSPPWFVLFCFCWGSFMNLYPDSTLMAAIQSLTSRVADLFLFALKFLYKL